MVVKGMGSDTQSGQFCGSRDAVFYHAEVGSLPSTFTEGLREFGVYQSVRVNTITPGEQVCQLCITTSISVLSQLLIADLWCLIFYL